MSTVLVTPLGQFFPHSFPNRKSRMEYIVNYCMDLFCAFLFLFLLPYEALCYFTKKGKACIVKGNNVKSQTFAEFSKRVGANLAWLIILKYFTYFGTNLINVCQNN